MERAGSGVRPRLHAAVQARGDAPTAAVEAAASPACAGAAAAVVAGAGVAGGASAAGRVAAVRQWLAGVDGAELSDRERIDLVAELERLKGSASAAQARTTDVLRRSRQQEAPQDAVRSLGSEVALARRESPTSGDRLVGLSRALVSEMPCTMRALTEGVIGERHAVAVVQATATLSLEDRTEVDRRVGPLLGRLGVAAAGRAAGRVAAELDAASVVRRMAEAARSRRVTVRPAPDGMAYLTVLAPLRDAVGALAALRARAALVVGGQCPDEAPDGRGLGAVMADTATRLMAGRAVGQVQPIEVHLVMTDTAVFGPSPGKPAGAALGGERGAAPNGAPGSAGGCGGGVAEPARIPGHGSVPAPVARQWLREAGQASVWLRRLYTSPDGRDLVAMDSRRRVFTGLLRRMLVLRDDRCTTPWCDGLVAHADHATPAREGGATDFDTGNGKCARCNYVKEAPGWRTTVVGTHPPGATGEGAAVGHAPHELELTTPSGHRYRSVAPPLLGWGWRSAAASAGADRATTESQPAVAAIRRDRTSGPAGRQARSSREDRDALPGAVPRQARSSREDRDSTPGALPRQARSSREDRDSTGSTLQRYLAGLVDDP